SKCNQNFICVWCICNTTLEGLVVGANGGIGEVLQRNIEDDTCGTALFYCWQQGGGVCCITEVVAELQRVNQSRTVLDFAIKTSDSCLAVCFQLAAEQFNHARSENCTDIRCDFVNTWVKVFYETLAVPWVFDDSSHHSNVDYWVNFLTAFGENLFSDCGDLTDFH